MLAQLAISRNSIQKALVFASSRSLNCTSYCMG